MKVREKRRIQGKKKGERNNNHFYRLLIPSGLVIFPMFVIEYLEKRLPKGNVYFGSQCKRIQSILAEKAWQRGQVAGWLHCILYEEAEGQQKVDPGYKTSRYVPKNPLPLARLHLLKVYQFSQTVQRTGGLLFKLSTGHISHSNHSRKCF